MTTNLPTSADPKIKDIITSLDDDKIGKVSYFDVIEHSNIEITVIFTKN